jgi:hypothetical protein
MSASRVASHSDQVYLYLRNENVGAVPRTPDIGTENAAAIVMPNRYIISALPRRGPWRFCGFHRRPP